MARTDSVHLFPSPEGKGKKSTEFSESRANGLGGKEWTRHSISVWNDIRRTAEEAKLGHPAMFPGALVERILLSFTKDSEKIVLDPFAGSGATLVAAKRMGKRGIGFEVAKQYHDLSVRRLRQTQSRLFVSNDGPEAQVHYADACDIDKLVPASSADICVTSPPYWDILSRKRSADYKAVKDYAEGDGDLSRIGDYEQFLDALAVVFSKVRTALKPKGYCIVVVMDIRKQDRFYSFHSDLAARLCRNDVGLFLDDIVIWDRRHEYNNLRPLGYPTTFRINKIHEYILIFRKPQ